MKATPENEAERYNKIGTKVMGVKYSSLWDAYVFDVDCNKIDGPVEDVIWMHKKDWNPYHNIAQAMMVLDTFKDWEVVKQKGEGRINRTYTCRIYIGISYFMGVSDDIRIACMRAIEKAMEGE